MAQVGGGGYGRPLGTRCWTRSICAAPTTSATPFSTWLQDAGLPARVIDEVMGHQATGRAGRHRGSAIGAHYRHTTPEMASRLVAAIEARLAIVVQTAEAALDHAHRG